LACHCAEKEALILKTNPQVPWIFTIANMVNSLLKQHTFLEATTNMTITIQEKVLASVARRQRAPPETAKPQDFGSVFRTAYAARATGA
jgi:hypothetical protein